MREKRRSDRENDADLVTLQRFASISRLRSLMTAPLALRFQARQLYKEVRRSESHFPFPSSPALPSCSTSPRTTQGSR